MEESSENASPHAGASLANGFHSGDGQGNTYGSSGTQTANNMSNGSYSATGGRPNGALSQPNGTATAAAGGGSTGGPGAPAATANGAGGNSTIGGKGGCMAPSSVNEGLVMLIMALLRLHVLRFLCRSRALCLDAIILYNAQQPSIQRPPSVQDL